jgi:hypothetical protein
VLQTHQHELVSVPLGAGWLIVHLVLENQRCPVEEYLDGAGVDADGFFAFVNMLLKYEPFAQVGKRFKKLRNVSNVYQITVNKDRYLSFRCRDLLILTHGFRKTTNETPRDQIQT